MPSITIKNIPEQLLERLRQRATDDQRSMNREVIHLLNTSLAREPADDGAVRLARAVDAQVKAWARLAGRWESNVDAATEIEQIYAARTGARHVEL